MTQIRHDIDGFLMRFEGRRFFLGIGAQRSGTTWLASYLLGHPQVCMSIIKELHVFDCWSLPEFAGYDRMFVEALQKRAASLPKDPKDSDPSTLFQISALADRLAIRNLDDYRQYFANRLRNEKALGEITPSYALLEDESWQKIADYFKEILIIYILRNPADRFWSQCLLEKRRNPDFDYEEGFERHLDDARFLRRSDYETTLRRLDRFFPRDALLVFFYEDLFGADGTQILRKLTNKLGVAPVPGNLQTRVFDSKASDLGEEKRKLAVRQFRPTYEFVREWFGGYLPESWKADLITAGKE